MGEVWAAEDTVLGRSVAVKLLKPELLDEPGFLDRFRAEARHTAALAHSGIAGIYDYGEDQHVAYLVMELVDGEPLSTMLARDGALPIPTAVSILAQTSAALGAAHRAGVVHRDVKPGNLLITPDGRVKITDFGIAKVVDSVPLTATGQVLGTPQYIAPEQATGSSATAASDIYSLGVIGYEMLAGRRPFVGDTPLALAMAHVHQPPPPLPADVPAELAEVVTAMLAKNPNERPVEAGALATRLLALQADLSGRGVSPLPSPDPGQQATVLHTAVHPSAAAGQSTEVAPAPPVQLPAGQAPTRFSPILIAFVLVLLVAVAAVLATRNGEDPTLTDAGSTTLAIVAATVLPSTPIEPPTTPPVPTATPIVFDPTPYIGLDRDDAKTLLEALNYEVREKEVKRAGGEKDSVVDVQFEPNAGPAGSSGRVTLLYSDGKGEGG